MRINEIIVKSFVESNGLQRYLARKLLFGVCERLGFHIVGDHFYEPIPNVRSLRRNYSESRRELPAGSSFSFNEQALNHSLRIDTFGRECANALATIGFKKNPYFRMHDAASLYCIIRSQKLSSVVEIGQGYSTLVAVAALNANAQEHGMETRLLSIDPYARLDCQGNSHVQERIVSIKKTVQEVPVAEIAEKLGPGSLLITDSSHIFKCGSDVEHLMRNVYPQTPQGTLIHVHDIYTPYPTPLGRLVDEKLFFNEQDHLEGFLAFNDQFELFCPVYWFFRDSEQVKNSYQSIGLENDLPGNSFYFVRK